jgi:hypothetical protein
MSCFSCGFEFGVSHEKRIYLGQCISPFIHCHGCAGCGAFDTRRNNARTVNNSAIQNIPGYWGRIRASAGDIGLAAL